MEAKHVCFDKKAGELCQACFPVEQVQRIFVKKLANASQLVIKIFRLKSFQKEYYVRFEELDGTASQKKSIRLINQMMEYSTRMTVPWKKLINR